MNGYEIVNKNYQEVLALNFISRILNVKYESQMTWEWLRGNGGKNMYCDGYFKEFNLVVEYDGVQHRKPVSAFGGMETFNRQVANDKLKDQLLNEHGIKLLRIPSNEDWHEEEYITSKLSEIGIEVNSYATNT